MLHDAISLHRKGQLAEAAALYRKILARDADNADALHLLGVVATQSGNPKGALALIGRAIALRPKDAGFHMGLGNALQALRRSEEAVASFDRALLLHPAMAEVLSNRGIALRDLKRFAEALESFDRALVLKPDFADASINRGQVLQDLGREAEALASYDRALELVPRSFTALNNRANVLQDLKRFEEALVSYERALALMPDSAEVHGNRGNALRALHRYDEALASYEHALALKPGNPKIHCRRGIVLTSLKRFDAAIASFDRALQFESAFAEALDGRASVFRVQGKIAEAIAGIEQALALKADDAEIHTNLIFALNFDPAATAEVKQAERARWNESHASRFAPKIAAHGNDKSPHRPLRIGYVTSHFRRQAASHSFGGVILNHDPQQFEVFCYSGTAGGDDVTALLRARAKCWHETARLSDDALAALIRSDRIDILVDLAGHMSGHRLGAFARKPAPVQVTGWGEPTGTGLKTMDYLLADSVLVPEPERALLAERVVELPNFLGYWQPDRLPEPGELPALTRGAIQFGSFNRLDKLSDPTLRVWAAILRRLVSAHLTLKIGALADSGQRSRLEQLFRSEGVAPDRLTLLGGSDHAAHFAAYRNIDIALDPFPHGGGMTTLDALWMGVPVVTWAGSSISSRLAAASLSALGLRDFIADSPEAYVELALAKAADLAGLSQLRGSLRARLAASEFGDPIRYCRAVEKAYRVMWQRWCHEDQNEGRHLPPI